MRSVSKIKVMSSLVILSLTAGSLAQAGIKEVIGQIAGGVIGGVLCNELGIGKGNGRTAAVALCAVGGSLIGGEIGQDMDEADARAFEESQRRSFDGDLNRDYSWDGSRYGSRTGVRGTLRPVRQGYHRQTREVCREYQSSTHRGNRTSQMKSIVCKRNDGSFYSLEERSLFINGRLVERESTERSGTTKPPVIAPNRRTPPPPVRPMPDFEEEEYDRDYDRRDRRDRRTDGRGTRGPIAPYCNSWDVARVQVGDRVYTRYGQVGTFQGFNRSGVDASVAVSNYIQIVRNQDLGLQGCHFGLTSGQRVSTRFGQQGVVGGIFSNGDVVVQMNQHIQILRRDDIFH